MGKPTPNPIRGIMPEAVIISGIIQVDDGDNAAVIAGRGFTVAQSTTTVTVTWSGNYKNTFGIVASADNAEISDLVVTSYSSTGFVLTLPLTPTADRLIHFNATVSSSSLPTT